MSTQTNNHQTPRNILKTSLFLPGNAHNLPTLPTLTMSPRRAQVGVEDLDETLTHLQRKLGHVRIGGEQDWNISDAEVENLVRVFLIED
jgi:hypothetical protein